VAVQSLRMTIGVNETVATVTQRLTQQEVEQAHTLRVRCPAAFAAVFSAPAADAQRWCRMETALQHVTTAVAGLQQGAGREPTGQGPDMASRRLTQCSKELMSGAWPRGGAGRKSESCGAKHKNRAARVQARGRWRRAANNVARSETARRGSSQAQITGAKQDRRHDGRQGERPFAKLTL
jgi:hypothetical protein